ncbi:stage V sporulation protein D [Clostridium sp. SYSU_GA19001]|uniref:stage V sporulation protein D n=1 Tax=Clostridium caldaquaticum TaxID=2940653 RepID=UPI0020778E88|nr:stage V sporulation protein D [Clostridium caldaquaticum]MCM8711003.1 stage V sporulation protein D [Clostridium caldaquaticum]
MARDEYRDKVIIKKRMLISFSILFILFFLLCIRLSYIMIVQSEHLTKLAKEQWTSDVKIDAKRGRILDRYGRELAVSANVFRVDLDMNTFRQYLDENGLTKEQIAPKIANALNMESDEVLKILNKTLPGGLPMASANLARRIEKAEADKVRDLNIRGLLVSSDTKRYYPNDNFLSHVLGFVRSDGVGLNGVELSYDEVLSGIPGRLIAETDNKSKGQPYIISEFTKPVDGKDLVLTIDEMIQHFAEKAAAQALSDNKAKAVTIIVMDPNNGEILAMANKPDFNPNDPWEQGKTDDELQKMWRNRAVSDTFEPGSIFKVITAYAAMEEKLVEEDDRFVCGGSSRILNRTIHCWKRTGHGEQNFVDILKNSCNVGFMELGRRLGKQNLVKYINQFGFGKKTGIDLPGEAKGIIRKVEDITDVDVATISFGQSNTVSAIQYLTALNAIANGGKLITPHIMKEVIHYDEDNKKVIDQKYEKYNERSILKEDVANTLREYLEKVVSEGGGKNAYIPGYHIAGKTGTAQKVDSVTKTYAAGKYIASFGGMAPADKPIISLFVSIDEPDPSNYYAGQIAAPVAKQIFNDIFNYLGIEADASAVEIAESMKKDVLIPELRGMKKTEAVKILKELKLEYEIDSKGEYIVDMNPKPGYSVKEGKKIVLYTGTGSNYNKEVVVPNLIGYSKEKASQILEELGLKAEFTGEGLVAEQNIEEGQKVGKGTTLFLELDIVPD